MKQIKNKRIPTADSDDLRDNLSNLHGILHTPEGLHDFSESRRSLVDHGLKARAIATELNSRGATPTPCKFCLPDSAVVSRQQFH